MPSLAASEAQVLLAAQEHQQVQCKRESFRVSGASSLGLGGDAELLGERGHRGVRGRRPRDGGTALHDYAPL